MSDLREVLATKPDALFSQSEDANIDYTVNWIGRIGSLTIVTSVWKSENLGGIKLGAQSNTDSTAKIRLSGATNSYLITNTVTLSDSQVMQFQFLLNIKSNDRINSNLYFSRDYH